MYPLTPDLLDFLLSPGGQTALDDLAQADLSQQATLSLLTRLRRTFSPAQAAVLLDQARLRRQAGSKFPQAGRLLFTDEALQQASSRAVATYRAGLFRRYRRVADLGCGIGADTIALARAGLEVLAVERDPVRARLIAANLDALGLAGHVQVVCADWTTLTLGVDAAFVDPARRAAGRRIFRLDRMEPPIAAIQALRGRLADVAVKTAPGIRDGDIPPTATVEFISEARTLKEALLRFGGLRGDAGRLATLLPGPHHLDNAAPDDDVAVLPPLAFLHEPDPAIIRASLVRHLAVQLGAAQIDPDIAYLTSESPVETPFARSWPVLRHGPFHLKTLNRWLRELGAGLVVVKKRGSAIEPDAFRRRLKTTAGAPPRTLFLTRQAGRPWMILAAEERKRPQPHD